MLIEIDTGEGRGGVAPDDDLLLEIAARLGTHLAGVLTHAGHSYAGRSVGRHGAHRGGRACRRWCAPRNGCGRPATAAPIVSMGSSPTALHARQLDGVTEVRAGVYMFGDLFQAEIGTHDLDEIALTVLTSVIGRRPGRLLVDAGGLALSKDRSTADAPKDYGFGLVLDMAGKRSHGDAIVRRAYQEHGVVEADRGFPLDLPVGARLRIAPNHTCMTAAAHDRYFVVEGSDEVVAIWHRVNGW